MRIPWIDLLILIAAAFAALKGAKRGFGVELWRILRRLFPAVFGFGLYRAMAAMLVKLPGLGQGAARFWGFIIIFGAVMLLMHKGRGRIKTSLTSWGKQRPKSWGMAAGAVRSLMTSGLVIFVLSMVSVEAVHRGVREGSWLAAVMQRL